MTSAPAPGDVIAGKYRIEELVGRGGMGVVMAGVHLQLGQRIAIKFLLSSGANDKARIVARFEREARAAAALQSEHVARVIDVGRLPDDLPYMVMELLDGADLATELRRRGPLPVKEAVVHILEACDAIGEAHGLGIIHRDLKPSNLFLVRRPKRAPFIKVVDFGISKTSSATDTALDLTHTSELFGSPLYMSPEQLRATKSVDARSDIWSLGVTLHELLAGAPPFTGTTMAELSANILTAPPADLRAVAPDVPAGLAAVIARCLEKAPEARFASVEELVLALAPFATTTFNPTETQPLQPTSPPPAAVAAQSPAASTLPLLVTDKPTVLDKQAVSDAAVSYRPEPPTRWPLVVFLALAFLIVVTVAKWKAERPSEAVATDRASATTSVAPEPSALASAMEASAPSALPSASASAPAVPLPPAAIRTTAVAPHNKDAAAPASSSAAPPASAAPSTSQSPLKLKLE